MHRTGGHRYDAPMLQMPSLRTLVLPACACLGASGLTHAQLVLSEILENPPGHSFAESAWEYIEFYGAPGVELDGFAVLVIKGGADDDRNGIPEIQPHIDEVFLLDGMRTNEQGFALIYNTLPETHRSGIESLIPPDMLHGGHARSFQASAPASREGAMRLDQDGSSTYLLVRTNDARLFDAILAPGTEIDADFDGRLDLYQAPPPQTYEERLQIVDMVCWSNRGGKEYGWIEGQEISETHGINPDALSRIRFYLANPGAGHRTKDEIDPAGRISGFQVLATSIADESFVYGVLDSQRFPNEIRYYTGSDLEGWPQTKSPTDSRALPIIRSGHDPEPDSDPFPKPSRRSAQGELRLTDLDVDGFTLTPGTFNDHPAARFTQQRFIQGDLTFDGVVDEDDLHLASILMDASLNERVESIHGWTDARWQGPALQQVLALANLSDDEPGLDITVQEDDLSVLRSLLGQ